MISLETGEAQGADEGRTLALPLRIEAGRLLIDLSAFVGRPVLGKAS